MGLKMKKRSYGNVVKAARLIRKKGYDKEESFKIALQCFDNMEGDNSNGYKNGMPVEWYINLIRNKEE